MIYGFKSLSINKYGKRYNSRLFEKFRKAYYKSLVGRKHSEETKNLIRVKAMGRKLSTEHKRNISLGGLGKKHSEETKKKLSHIQIGTKHHQFHGYYITPWGKFGSSYLASTIEVNYQAVAKWCKESDKIITNRSISHSPYLKALPESPIGKTFKDIGFGFKSV